ncbi:hypothetical protein D043_4857A, partial [Vibrio parahaemolyticus EKP-021]
MNCGDNGSA